MNIEITIKQGSICLWKQQKSLEAKIWEKYCQKLKRPVTFKYIIVGTT